MRCARFALMTILLVSPLATAFAKGHGGNNRASFGQDINVSEGESVGDIACSFCTVHVHGDVTGDVAVFWGSVIVDPGQTIAGDTAIAGGNLRLEEGASVHGDVAILSGVADVAEGAIIHGDRAVLPPPLGTLLLFSPLIVLALIIWLIVYLVRRNRYRFPQYPQGYGAPPPPR
ncbi:MAG: polymer-forming cytoskeletal protein [Edaphobacter sp.]|uniref:polymer-forming cytoskeletal protein n=1 Tax=Edaphobacter sp. TaxID=1934404 RepID=UPI002388F28C|nr:polymer-forming cytoskeletal protein [Edaphobacter sp.]MDE1176590.1 polymer-forming cytoskeletal protein [Edaphobacter sp.]